MEAEVRAYIAKYPEEIVGLFEALRALIERAAPRTVEEKLWARMPSYTVGDAFVRLIPFKDHINIEARAMASHAEELSGYRLTPKGFLQLSPRSALPADTLLRVFQETLAP